MFPGPYDKAAALTETLIRSHPFVDGNKRTALVAGLTLLEMLTGRRLRVPAREAVEACVAVAQNEWGAAELSRWMREKAESDSRRNQMAERRVPTPHHVYDETKDLESFSVSRLMGLITAQVTYVPDVTPVPLEGQIVEFRVLGTSVQAIVNHTSLMSRRSGPELHIQARRMKD